MDFKSEGMNRIFSKMDRYILELEEDVKFFSRKADKLEKEQNEIIEEKFKNLQIILLRIRDMQDINCIHKYINETIEENRKNGVNTK